MTDRELIAGLREIAGSYDLSDRCSRFVVGAIERLTPNPLKFNQPCIVFRGNPRVCQVGSMGCAVDHERTRLAAS